LNDNDEEVIKGRGGHTHPPKPENVLVGELGRISKEWRKKLILYQITLLEENSCKGQTRRHDSQSSSWKKCNGEPALFHVLSCALHPGSHVFKVFNNLYLFASFCVDIDLLYVPILHQFSFLNIYMESDLLCFHTLCSSS